jgi:hypothetical protein
MTVSLINKPEWREGGLWFVIPADLQADVVPWIKSKLHEVTVMRDRKSYRSYITKKGLDNKYSQPIHATHRGNYFDFYACYGEWRVGQRGSMNMNAEALKAMILRSIEEYADVSMAINESQLIVDMA